MILACDGVPVAQCAALEPCRRRATIHHSSLRKRRWDVLSSQDRGVDPCHRSLSPAFLLSPCLAVLVA